MEISRQNTAESTDQASETLFHNRRRCCFYLPCFDRSPASSASPAAGPTWWQKIRTEDTATGSSSSSLWSRGVGALMKIREWSEIVAGPKWKTFIRRFNRSRSANKHANLQYDPLSYAMNFDEGQNGHLEEGEDGYYYGSRNFSSRSWQTSGNGLGLGKFGESLNLGINSYPTLDSWSATMTKGSEGNNNQRLRLFGDDSTDDVLGGLELKL